MFRIAPNLSLPVEAVTQAFGILGRRGSGKTNTAVVMAEEMLRGGYPIVVLDPLGVWWGLRSTADGKGDGFPVVIFGGEHADVPLQPTGGRLVADFIVGERVPAILDLFGFGENDMRRFVADFADQFYRTNRDAIHWFVDEADEFAPQGAGSKGPISTCHGAMQNIVRRGRVKGIGVSLISQRSAVLDKSVLYQAECLVAMQSTGPRDLEAIEGWLKYHGTKQDRDEIMATLPKLQQGDAWFYSPSWLKIVKRVHIRERQTFDSSRTPKPGEARRQPKRVADVDLGRIQKQMAATVEAAKANDPKELRKQIAELKKQAAGKVVDPQAIANAEARGEQRGRQAAEAELRQLRSVVNEREGRLSKVDSLASKIGELAHLNGEADGGLPNGIISHVPARVVQRAAKAPQITERITRPKIERAVESSPDSISKAQQRVLDALAWLESIGTAEPSNIQLGAVALINTSGGYFSNVAGPLASAGLIVRGGGSTRLTDAGRALANPIDSIVTLVDYHDMLRNRVRKLKSANGKTLQILEALIDRGGQEMSAEEIGTECDVDHTGGYFSNSIGPLSTLGLIDRQRGMVRPTELLFPGALA